MDTHRSAQDLEPALGQYPFCFPSNPPGTLDTDAVRHWRDHSQYLTCGGLTQNLQALYQYNCGVFGNALLLSVPILCLSLLIAWCFTWLRQNSLRLTLVALVIVVLSHLTAFVIDTLSAGHTQLRHRRSPNVSHLLLGALALTLLIDSTPLCVDLLRQIRPQGTASLAHLLTSLGAAAVLLGLIIKYISVRPGIRRRATIALTFIVGWGATAALLITLVDYLYFGLPPYGLFLLIPFGSLLAILCSLIYSFRPRSRPWLIISLLISICLTLITYSYSIEWLSTHCRLSARIAGTFTRPLSEVTKALESQAKELQTSVSPTTLSLLSSIQTQSKRVRSLEKSLSAEDYKSTPFWRFIAPIQNITARYILVPSANRQLFRSYDNSGNIEQWGLLTTLRPQLHHETIAYFHLCAQLDKLPLVEKERLRSLLTTHATQSLDRSLRRQHPPTPHSPTSEVVADVKAMIVDRILSTLFCAGSDGVDAHSDTVLDHICSSLGATGGATNTTAQQVSSDVKALVRQSGVTESLVDALQKIYANSQHSLADSTSTETSVNEPVARPSSLPLSSSLLPSLVQRVFGPSPDIAHAAVCEALIAAMIRLYDADKQAACGRLQAALDILFTVQPDILLQEHDVLVAGTAEDWRRTIEHDDHTLALDAAGLAISPSRGARDPEPFTPGHFVYSVIAFNLMAATGGYDGAYPLTFTARYHTRQENIHARCVRYRTQFICSERAIRPANKSHQRARHARLILAELYEPSVPTAVRFRENIDENEQILYKVFNHTADAGSGHLLLPSIARRLLMSHKYDDSQTHSGETVRLVGLGRYGNLDNLSTMVEQLADGTLLGRSLLVSSLLLGALAFCLTFVSPNTTSFHSFYRDALTSAFLVAPRNTPDSCEVLLSQLADYANGSVAPYPLINAIVNDSSKGSPSARERGGRHFLFSPLFVGGFHTTQSMSDDQIRYLATADFERLEPGFSAASAMTVSGGAAAPLMGRYSNWAIRLAMVLANLRLGYWLQVPTANSAAVRTVPEQDVIKEEQRAILNRRLNVCREGIGPASKVWPCCPLGLSLSGGGIRSAAINFGITQGLYRLGIWPMIDYLSTVSGGGYTGTGISIYMRAKTSTGPRDTTAAVSGIAQTVTGAGHYSFRRAIGRILCLYREALPIDFPNDTGGFSWVNVSDGGHFENLGIYALLKRRCCVILAGDGEADPNDRLDGLSRLILLASIDLGIKIEFRSGDLDRVVKPAKHVGRHYAIAKITYPQTSATNSCVQPHTGWLVYVRSSLTGDEDQVIQGYKAASKAFPHETTLDQFFTEEQFEAYRRLGEHMITSAIEDLRVNTVKEPLATLYGAVEERYTSGQDVACGTLRGGVAKVMQGVRPPM